LQRAKEAAEVVGRNAAIWRMISGSRSSKVLTSDVDISVFVKGRYGAGFYKKGCLAGKKYDLQCFYFERLRN